MDLELAIDVAQVRLEGVVRHKELSLNGDSGVALREKGEDFLFTRREVLFLSKDIHALKQQVAGAFRLETARRVDARHTLVRGHGTLGVPQQHAPHRGHKADKADDPEHLLTVEDSC